MAASASRILYDRPAPEGWENDVRSAFVEGYLDEHTVGFAYGNVDYSANTNFDNGITYPVDFTETKTGWTAGGGVEYALTNHWTVRAEYLHYDLGDASRTQPQLSGGVPTGSLNAIAS